MKGAWATMPPAPMTAEPTPEPSCMSVAGLAVAMKRVGAIAADAAVEATAVAIDAVEPRICGETARASGVYLPVVARLFVRLAMRASRVRPVTAMSPWVGWLSRVATVNWTSCGVGVSSLSLMALSCEGWNAPIIVSLSVFVVFPVGPCQQWVRVSGRVGGISSRLPAR